MMPLSLLCRAILVGSSWRRRMTTQVERNQAATAYVGEIDDRVTDALLWELFLQAGPVVNVHLPKDKVTAKHQGFGFVEFATQEDCEYAIRIMNMVKLYGRPIRVNPATRQQNILDVGANLYIGNLDPDIDEKVLYDTFSAFGMIISTPKIMRDPETGRSRGFGFVSFDCFEASDAAIESMNGQFLCNRPISVGYAFKKDTKGERHGSVAERLLAAKNPSRAKQQRPHTMFAPVPGQMPPQMAPQFGGMPPQMGMPGQPMMAGRGNVPPPGMMGMMGMGWGQGVPPGMPGMPPPGNFGGMGMPPMMGSVPSQMNPHNMQHNGPPPNMQPNMSMQHHPGMPPPMMQHPPHPGMPHSQNVPPQNMALPPNMQPRPS